MKFATKNWIDTAGYDLKTADAMLKSGRYIYVAFMCHLAIEKMVKAVISTETEGLPPKSHSLLYLSGLDLTRRTLRWLKRDQRLKT